ncbi:MAG: ABC transporter permease [Anaerolineae bacterium]|nr:ABC transporter permease [Anaerolineae bacterium]
MTTHDLIRLVLSNLRRMKARVAMTAIGVIIGTAAVVVLVSLGAGLQQRAQESLYSFGSLSELQVYAEYYERGETTESTEKQVALNDKAVEQIRQLPDVLAATPLEYLYGGEIRMGRQTGYASIIGVDPTAFALLAPQVVSGTIQLGRDKVVAGASSGEGFLNWETYQPGDPLPELMDQTLRLVLYPFSNDHTRPPEPFYVTLKVTGKLKQQGYQYDYSIFMPLKQVLDLNTRISGTRPNKDKDGYSQVLVKVTDAKQAPLVEQAIKEMGFQVQSARSQLEEINSLFLVIQTILGGIGAVSLLVAAFGIANTMMMAIYERTREIGLMKAIGASNQDVMSVFLSEAGGIGFIGGAGGVLLAIGLVLLLNLLGNSLLSGMGGQVIMGPGTETSTALAAIPLWLPPFAIVFATFIGIASGVYPALRAAALSPIAALRYE